MAVVPIGGLLNELKSSGRPVFFRSITTELVPEQSTIDELAAVEEITFFGYPSGLYDEHNVTPLARRGITATPAWNDFKGEPTFLIDAGVFPGSSGSPVFILNQGAYTTKDGLAVGNRVMLLGILTDAIVLTDEELPDVFLGIGKVIKSRVLLDFTTKVAEELMGGEIVR